MTSAEFNREISKERLKAQRLRQELERINSERKDSEQLLAIYERGLKQVEKVEMESAKKMKKIEDALASSLAALKRQGQSESVNEVIDAGNN